MRVPMDVNVDGVIPLERQYEWFSAGNVLLEEGDKIVYTMPAVYMAFDISDLENMLMLPKFYRLQYGHLCLDVGTCNSRSVLNVLRIGKGLYDVCGSPITEYTEFIDVKLPTTLWSIHTLLFSSRYIFGSTIDWKNSNLI